MSTRLPKYLSTGLSVLVAGGALIASVDCSSPRGCANDTDCFEGQTCSPDGVCVAVDTPLDAGTADVGPKDVSSGEDTRTRVDTSDTGAADTEPTPEDTSDGGMTPDDTETDAGTDTRDSGDRDTEPQGYACENPEGSFCDIEDDFEGHSFETCATREDLETTDDPDSCDKNIACGTDFEPVTGKKIQAALCRKDEEGDEYKVRYNDCETFQRKVTVQLSVEKACAPDLYKLTKGGECQSEGNLECYLEDDETELIVLVNNRQTPKIANKLTFGVEPDCQEPCQIETPYELTLDIQER